jgi:hypothetical protein
MKKRIPNSHIRSFVLHRGVRCCVAALTIAFLAGAAEAQFWTKKKKPEDKASTAAGNSTSNNASAGASTPGASSLGAWTGPKLRLAVMDLNGSALKSQIAATPATTPVPRDQLKMRNWNT